jgi:hypothetical protein
VRSVAAAITSKYHPAGLGVQAVTLGFVSCPQRGGQDESRAGAAHPCQR